MKGILLTTVLLSMIAIFGSNVETGICAENSCGREVSNVVEGLLKNWSSECGKVADGKTGSEASKVCLNGQKYQPLASKLKQLANNGPFTLGPRELAIGTSQNGTIVNPAFRTFLTSALLDKDSLTVKLEKKSGKGGATIRICKIDENKKYTSLKNMSFEEGGGVSTQSVTVSGVKAHLVQVFIDGTGSVSKAFDYTLSTSAN